MINALSLLAVVSLVLSGLVPLSWHLLFPNSHISSDCHCQITVGSFLEITRRNSPFFPSLPLMCVVLLFASLAAVSPGLWRQIVICSFASLTPPHMALENWKWKQWKLMLRLLPNPLPILLQYPLCSSNSFQSWMLGLYGSQERLTVSVSV